MKAYVESYGCAHNESDARIIRGSIISQGCDLVTTPDNADVIFLNTCGVKLATERRMLHRLKALLSMGKRVIVCGCLPKINEAQLRQAGAVEMLDTDSLGRIPDVLAGKEVPFSQSREDKHSLPCEHGTIAPIQISEGCLGSCAFCGTRNARGSLHSYALNDIVRSCGSAISHGARELWLTSEDTAVYGFDIGASLPELINAVAGLSGDFKVRVGMMNPGAARAILPQLLEAFASDKVYKFAHVPVQSGSPAVLRAMRRQHTVGDFELVAKAFRGRFPDCVISTDVIVGFPGESDADFRDSLSLMERVRPDVTNVSKFYPRPNTAAALMGKVPSQTTKARSVECAALGRKLSLEQNGRFVGKEFDTVALRRAKSGGVVGRAPNYKKTVFEGELGKEYSVRVVEGLALCLKAVAKH